MGFGLSRNELSNDGRRQEEKESAKDGVYGDSDDDVVVVVVVSRIRNGWVESCAAVNTIV